MIFSLGFSQKKKSGSKGKTIVEKETVIIYTEEDAQKSNEPRIIAGFLKQNPTSPKADFFKRKLMTIIMADNKEEAKPSIKPISKDKIATAVKNNDLNSNVSKEEIKADIIKAARTGSATTATNATAAKTSSPSIAKTNSKSEPSEKAKQTAAMLSHLFNNDPSDKEAYVNIKNKSKCNLIVKFTGKSKFYNLYVPANGQNFVLIEKGEYILTTMVCDAKYSSAKKITQDIELSLSY
jgi:hypothetical protein